MIIGKHRREVIENICKAVQREDFFCKTEVDDPVLTPAECRAVAGAHIAARNTFTYRMKSRLARFIANHGSTLINRDTEIRIEGDLPDMTKAVILTSNHFSPLENTVIRHFVRQQGKKRLHIVSLITNFAMTGPVGFLMNYADTVPIIPTDPHYLRGDFQRLLEQLTVRNEAVLIYPEQELWFNYRKPRPLKRGVYDFASRLGVPVVCCFVEMVDRPAMDTEEFHKVRYVLHVLGTLYPDPDKSVKENSLRMCQQDYEWKKAAYEAAYGKKLDYSFSPSDIAGWVEGHHEKD